MHLRIETLAGFRWFGGKSGVKSLACFPDYEKRRNRGYGDTQRKAADGGSGSADELADGRPNGRNRVDKQTQRAEQRRDGERQSDGRYPPEQPAGRPRAPRRPGTFERRLLDIPNLVYTRDGSVRRLRVAAHQSSKLRPRIGQSQQQRLWIVGKERPFSKRIWDFGVFEALGEFLFRLVVWFGFGFGRLALV